MITSRRAGLLTAAALLIAPATVALAPASARAAPPPANTDICKKPSGYYQHHSDPRWFWSCDGAYRPTRRSCPGGQWFNEEGRPCPVCDWPDASNADGTVNLLQEDPQNHPQLQPMTEVGDVTGPLLVRQR
ncbi:chitin binding peritrophin-A domain-containing protein [Kitasatospora purpeofusca]|uniref:chitin binding peritrophin-A domain-containing protein n=1 Tax=Kitasatospora purpeofusca TaxID=67352 RepID=UPI0036695965